MAENTDPKSAPSADAARGLPYYEKLRKDLRETLQKKRTLDKNIVRLVPFANPRECYTSFDLLETALLTLAVVIHRRADLPIRVFLLGGDLSGQHNQRFRQLHQRHQRRTLRLQRHESRHLNSEERPHD